MAHHLFEYHFSYSYRTNLGVEEDEVQLDEGEGQMQHGSDGLGDLHTRGGKVKLEQLSEHESFVDHRANAEGCKAKKQDFHI